MLYITNKMELFSFKVGVLYGLQMFKRRLVHGVEIRNNCSLKQLCIAVKKFNCLMY